MIPLSVQPVPSQRITPSIQIQSPRDQTGTSLALSRRPIYHKQGNMMGLPHFFPGTQNWLQLVRENIIPVSTDELQQELSTFPQHTMTRSRYFERDSRLPSQNQFRPPRRQLTLEDILSLI